jgi:hypothetical protein
MEINLTPGVMGPIPDGTPSKLVGNNWGALGVNSFGPEFLEWMRRGYIFSTLVSPAAPAAIPIYSTATNSPTLWNPSNSKKLVVPIMLCMGLAAIATYLDNSFMLAHLGETGENVGTGAPFSVFTNIAPKNCLLGGPTGKAKFSGAAVTFTTQPTPFFNLGLGTSAAGTEANLDWPTQQYEFKGAIGLPPGNAISLVGIVASSSTFVTSYLFAELPMPENT